MEQWDLEQHDCLIRGGRGPGLSEPNPRPTQFQAMFLNFRMSCSCVNQLNGLELMVDEGPLVQKIETTLLDFPEQTGLGGNRVNDFERVCESLRQTQLSPSKIGCSWAKYSHFDQPMNLKPWAQSCDRGSKSAIFSLKYKHFTRVYRK